MKAMKAMKGMQAEKATSSGGAVAAKAEKATQPGGAVWWRSPGSKKASQIAVVDWDEDEAADYVQIKKKHGIYYKPGPAGWESQPMFSPGEEDEDGQYFAVWKWHGWVYWRN